MRPSFVAVALGCLLCSLALSAENKKKNEANKNAPTQPDQAAVKAAQQKVTDAKAERTKAQSNLTGVVSKMRADFETGAEYKAAQDAQKLAMAEHDAARKPVVEKLKSSASYQAAEADNKKAQAELEDLRTTGAAPDQLTPAATKAMNTSTVLTKMEAEAANNDPKCLQAKKAMVDASAKLAALRKQFDEGIKNDPAWQGAKKDIETADNNVTQAEANAQKAQADYNMQLARYNDWQKQQDQQRQQQQKQQQQQKWQPRR